MLAIVRDRDDFAIVRHVGAHGLGCRGHFSYVADDEGFQSRCFEQPAHLRVKRLQVERHENVGLAVVDLVLENLFRIQGRVVDYRAAGFHHPEERDDIVRRVGQIEPDMYAGAHAEFLKSLGRPISEVAQISIRDFLVHEIEGGIIRPLGGRSLQNLVERHRRQFRVPTDTTWVRLDPGCYSHERHSYQSLWRLMEGHRSPKPRGPEFLHEPQCNGGAKTTSRSIVPFRSINDRRD